MVGVGAGVGISAHAVAPRRPRVHVPATQPWQLWYCALSWYLPDGQWKQFVWPRNAWYRPFSHNIHSPPEDGWNLPGKQSVHVAEPSMAKRPFAHALHDCAL